MIWKKYSKVSRDLKIQFICHCGENDNKIFRNMVENGAYCKKCVNIKNNEKKKQTRELNGFKSIYTTEMLKNIIERDRCSIDINTYEKLNRETRISFVCYCGETNDKMFRNIVDNGAFCKKCLELKTIDKRKQTSLQNYGVEYNFQTQEFKEKTKQTNLERYGVEHHMHTKEVKEKIKQTNLERYGVEHPLQNTEIKEKTKQTNLERYGTENPMQNTIFKQKLKQSMIAKYGVENPMKNNEFKQKLRQTIIDRYGVEYISQLEEFKEHIKQISLKKYGTEHPSQSEEIKEKIRQTNLKRYGTEYPLHFVTKDFEMPDGSVIKVQGYEPIVLQMLLDIGYDQDDIITSRSEVPEIWYLDQTNKKHRYYCDIYIKSENKIIEVKSPYTYNVSKEINVIKANTCKENGYKFEFWIIDDKDYSCQII